MVSWWTKWFAIDQNMILIIAYGNPLREDDGAGLVLAEKLDTVLRHYTVDVQRIETHQLLPELSGEIAAVQPDAVMFIDTRVATSPVERVYVERIRASEASSPGLGHHLNPQAVLTYAAALYDEAPSSWVVTVPGWQFDFGEALSARSQEAISLAFNDQESQLSRLVAELQELPTTRHNDVP